MVGDVDVAKAAPREIIALRRETLGYVSQFLRVVPRVPTVDVVAEPLLTLGVPPNAVMALMIGALTIQRLRKKAETELGAKFDIRAFHDQVLNTGALPMPVLEANCFAASEPDGQLPLSRQPFGLLFQALDELKPHEVYVATGCAPQFALWGGLMTTRAQHLKAAADADDFAAM